MKKTMFQSNTILLVEDDKDMQSYMKLLLEDECKKIFIAENGMDGFSMYKKYKPDIIITDLNMPIMDGIIMSKHIKDEDFNQPIILLTAYGDIKELQDAINIGLNAFISKPIENIEVLFSSINKLLKNANNCKRTSAQVNNKIEIVSDILHDNQEYIDFESLIKDTKNS